MCVRETCRFILEPTDDFAALGKASCQLQHTRPGSSRRPSACLADVIATRPRVLEGSRMKASCLLLVRTVQGKCISRAIHARHTNGRQHTQATVYTNHSTHTQTTAHPNHSTHKNQSTRKPQHTETNHRSHKPQHTQTQHTQTTTRTHRSTRKY